MSTSENLESKNERRQRRILFAILFFIPVSYLTRAAGPDKDTRKLVVDRRREGGRGRRDDPNVFAQWIRHNAVEQSHGVIGLGMGEGGGSVFAQKDKTLF